jgi:hypothetical protein
VLSEAAGEVSSDDRPTTLTHSHSCGSGAVILPPGRRVKVTFGERQVVAAAVPVCVGGCGCGCHLPTPKFHACVRGRVWVWVSSAHAQVPFTHKPHCIVGD